MLKAGDLARREDRQVKGVKIGKTRREQGISHVCEADQRLCFHRTDSTIPLQSKSKISSF